MLPFRRPGAAARRTGGASGILVLLLLLPPPVATAAPWVVITEIHPHPPQGGVEFVEILSREPPRADLSGWSLEGEVKFRFPPGTIALPGEYLVIAADPTALRSLHPSARKVLGPFSGRLDNAGGRLSLRNASGVRVCEVRYGSGGRWPASASGLGHTLSLLDPVFDPEVLRSWAPSARVGGTPGRLNFARAEASGKPIVKKGDAWKFARGTQPPPPGWRDSSFDDGKWESGPSGFGYGDGDDATLIEDMRGKYLALYTRKAFDVPDPASLGRLVLKVDYDDGFVAYLNGNEIARSHLGQEGVEVPPDRPAASAHEAGYPLELDLGQAREFLVAGKNVLAVQVHNQNLPSTDLSLTVELESRSPQAAGAAADPRLNEVLASGKPGTDFVEIHNPAPREFEAGGYFLSDDPAVPRKFKLPPSLTLRPFGLAVLTSAEMGEKFTVNAAAPFVFLSSPEGDRVVDALPLEGAGAEGNEKAGDGGDRGLSGRFPDGGRPAGRLAAPTPGEPNRAEIEEDLVLNEVMYHPVTGEDDDEYIEVHNRGTRQIDLQGFRLSGEAGFDFPAGASIPSGGFLVVAKDPAALVKKYGLPREKVLGPFRGRLADGGGRISLRDPRGNTADEVEYADSHPWPRDADGLGSSMELIDPRLDNSLPGSWAPSDDRSKARWETFRYVKEHRLFEGLNLSELQVMLLTEGQCLIDDLHLRGDREYPLDGSFERGGAGWTARGTHQGSGLCKEEAAHGSLSYRIVAEGRGNARHNHVSITIPEGLVPGKRYQVSFRAKWERGSQVLFTRTPGQGVAKVHRLSVPARLGTPGAENSARVRDPAPVIGTPVQEPVAPSPTEPVSVKVRLSSPSGVAGAWIHYRRDRGGEWLQAPLADSGTGLDGPAGDGVWGGQIPPLPPGKVEFYLLARDANGKQGTFPAGAPARTALYAVGLLPSKSFPNYTVLVSRAEWSAFLERPRMSNRLGDATLVYGDSRIFYNVGFRRRGSPFTRNRGNWRIVFGADRLDGRRKLTLDGQGGDGTRLNERLSYWFIDQLEAPNARQQYVHFRLLGQEEGIYEDVEKIDGGYLERWFEDPPGQPGRQPKKQPEKQPEKPPAEKAAKKASRKAGEAAPEVKGGRLYKVDDYHELVENRGRTYREAQLAFTSADPEDYRWNFPQRGNSTLEDYEPLIKLLHLLDPKTTPDKVLDERLEKAVDVDQWLRVLAARTLVDEWDTLGGTTPSRGKNAMLYLSGRDQRWRLLPWDCDLSWRRPTEPIFSNNVPALKRILDRPAYRRRYLGYLAYLAARKMEAESFDTILDDLHRFSRASTEWFKEFAQARRMFVLGQVPHVAFRVVEGRRVPRTREPDLYRAGGTAPVMAMRFRLNGREGVPRFLDLSRWTADFPVGPEGGEAMLQAVDFGGNEVAHAVVKIPERRGSVPLPGPLPAEAPPAPASEVASREKAGAAGTAPRPDPPADPAVDRAPEPPPPPAGAAVTAAAVPPEEAPEHAGEKAGEGRAAPAPGHSKEPAVAAVPEKGAAPAAQAEGTGGTGEAPAPRALRKRPGRARKAPAVSPDLKVPAGGARADEPPASLEPAGAKSSLWRFLIPPVVSLGIFIPAILFLRRRRQGDRSVERALKALGDHRFYRASPAFDRLCRADVTAVPELLEALEDDRRTPFRKIKRTPEGFTALSSPVPTDIRVRQIAALLLERLIGKPPGANPGPKDWQAHWERARDPEG